MNVKQIFTEILYEQLGGPLTKIEVASMIEKPKYDGMGDVAFPCFALAKIYRQSPQNIALQLIEKLTLSDVFARVEAVSGYHRS